MVQNTKHRVHVLFFSEVNFASFPIRTSGNEVAELVASITFNGRHVSFSIRHIMFLTFDGPWFYAGCEKCFSMLEPNDMSHQGEFVCPNTRCDVVVAKPVARYKLYFTVQDSTGTVDLTMLDSQAFKMLDVPAHVLYEKIINGETDAPLFPVELKNLINQTFGFKIEISEFNLSKSYYVFTVKKFTQEPAILAELKKKLNLQESDNTENSNLNDGSSTETSLKLKESEVASVTDSITPCSVNADFVVDIHPGLKRDLESLYDDKEFDGHSATKPDVDSGGSVLKQKIAKTVIEE